MTLVIATLTRRTVLLAADKRTIVTSASTGERLILSDTVNKIHCGANIALATIGKSDGNRVHEEIIDTWLESAYDAAVDPHPQLEALRQTEFLDKPRGSFCAVWWRSNTSYFYRTGLDAAMPEYEIYDEVGKARMYYDGTKAGVDTALNLFGDKRPPIGAFDVVELAEFSRFLIATAAGIERFGKQKLPAISTASDVIVIDKHGVRSL